jgi:hypothetical protein
MSIEEVKGAICALGDAELGRGAQDVLMQFEASRGAWTVAAQLLYDSSAQASQHHFRFFGAKMLYSKIQRDFDQLAESDVSAFMQSLVGHIINLSQEPNIEMKVCRYVCLSIAALAIQINQPGVIRAVLQWLNPVLTGAPHVILEFLALLPEECINQRVDVSRETREAFEHQLTDSFHEVLTFLGTHILVSELLLRNLCMACAWIALLCQACSWQPPEWSLPPSSSSKTQKSYRICLS